MCWCVCFFVFFSPPSKHNTPGIRSCHQYLTGFDVNSYMCIFLSVKTIITLTYIYTHSQVTELQGYTYVYNCGITL
jgi:hypothetical protein